MMNGVVSYKAKSDTRITELLNSKALKDAGIRVGKPKRKKPMNIIYDRNSKLKDEDVKFKIFMGNIRGCDTSEVDFKKKFELKTKYKDKSGGGRILIILL